jgi:hypothetical protein
MKRLVVLAAGFLLTAAHAQDSPPPPYVPSQSDVNEATRDVRLAWRDFNTCRRVTACEAYFESFGVAISFGDGSIRPFSHVQRLTASAHDCIRNARFALEQGDRPLAVQWVMASRIENIPRRDWLGNHPDAVLEALRDCCR